MFLLVRHLNMIIKALQSLRHTYGNHYPVDTGRKLNVLCTFNLRPVSMG